MKNYLITLFLGHAMSNEAWNYNHNGDDWPDLNIEANKCGTKNNQSPINLVTSGWPTISSTDDKFNALYTDLEDVEVTFNGHTSIVQVGSQM